MRILVIGPSLDRTKGGMATVIRSLLTSSIITKKHQLRYLASHVTGSVFEKLCVCLCSLIYLVLSFKKYEIIHIHSASDSSFFRKSIFLRLSKILKKRVVLHIHGGDFDSFYLQSNSLVKRYIAGTLYRSDVILVLSNRWRIFFEKQFNNQLKLFTLHNGIDIQYYKACVNKHNSFNNFLFLGRLEEKKGIYDLLNAIDNLINVRGIKGLKFYMGGDGDLERVQRIISEKNLRDNIKVLGWLNSSEKQEALRNVETLILPSYIEGLPMSIIEAMASGKVIISTAVGGIPDIVKDNYNGFLITAGDIDMLINSILKVNRNPSLMASFRINNITSIENDFCLESANLKLLKVYNRLQKT